jgi:hypothetical protein
MISSVNNNLKTIKMKTPILDEFIEELQEFKDDNLLLTKDLEERLIEFKNIKAAINYTRCSTQLFGVSKIEIDCVTINKEYKIIFENDETYVFINDFGQADEMYKKHFKDVKTK